MAGRWPLRVAEMPVRTAMTDFTRRSGTRGALICAARRHGEIAPVRAIWRVTRDEAAALARSVAETTRHPVRVAYEEDLGEFSVFVEIAQPLIRRP